MLEGIGNNTKSAEDKSTFGRLFKFLGWNGDKLLTLGKNALTFPFLY